MKETNNNSFYTRLSKDIKKWINQKYPENRKIKEAGIRGAASRFNNKDLVEIALEVKNSLRGEKLNYYKLEKITGIGRQIWSRRLSEEINKINEPIIKGRNFGISDDDTISHINIDYLIQKYGDNPDKLVSFLYHLEDSRVKFYNRIKELEKENVTLRKYKEENEKLKIENAVLAKDKETYQVQYQNLYLTSWYPELRKNNNLKMNLVDLNYEREKSTSLVQFEALFNQSNHKSEEKEVSRRNIKSNNLVNELISEFKDFFED